jgi:hypothetical protein
LLLHKPTRDAACHGEVYVTAPMLVY